MRSSRCMKSVFQQVLSCLVIWTVSYQCLSVSVSAGEESEPNAVSTTVEPAELTEDQKIKLSEYQARIDSDPDDPLPYRERAYYYYFNLSRFDDASNDLLTYLSLEREVPVREELRMLRSACEQTGDLEGAVEVSERLVKDYPCEIEFLELARLQRAVGQDESAAESEKTARELARAEKLKGVEALTAKIEESPSSPALLIWRAELWMRLGELENALSDVDKAILLDPGSDGAKSLRNQLLYLSETESKTDPQ
jgi:tetratricopeptide (TPR) repeat protein